MKIFKLFTTIIFLLILLVVGVLGYAGAIPGVSAVFGSNKPRDLKSPHTAQDLVAGQAKLGQSFSHVTLTDTVTTILKSGTVKVDTTLSAAEWAAHLEAIHPVKDLQIKLLDDRTFEAAGRIDTSRIAQAVQLLGYTNISEAKVLRMVEKYLPNNAVFFLRGKGSIIDNKPTIALDRVEIGRLSIATGSVAKTLTSYAQLWIDHVPGLSLSILEIQSSQVRVSGSIPKQIPQF